MQLQTDNFIEDLERWRDAYVKWMIDTKQYSKNTVELYTRVIEQFIEYSLEYQEEMVMKDIRTLYFANFVNFLNQEAKKKGRKINRDDKYLSKSTQDSYMKAIKGFFNYITDNNDELYTFDRYFRSITNKDKSKLEEKLIYLTEDEIESLLNTLERDKAKKGNYNAYRNSLLIKLMLYGGLRISEALNVTVEDFTLGQDDMYLINIYGKGGKKQLGYIAKKTIDDELKYFTEVAALKNDDVIMKTGTGKNLHRRNALTIVNRIYKRAGIRKEGLHLLRHTLAMRLTNKGVALVVIKKILRHSSISTTTIYAKASTKAVNEAIKGVDYGRECDKFSYIIKKATTTV